MRWQLPTLAGALVALCRVATAATFPPDSAWRAVELGGSGLSDSVADGGASGGLDLVGAVEQPVAYVAEDASDFFVRLRLNGDPRQGAGLRNDAWVVLLDLDGDLMSYELALVVSGEASEIVELVANSSSPATGDPRDPAETVRASWPVDLAAGGRVQVSNAPSSFGGTGDWFLDFAVPLGDLTAAGAGSSVRAWFGSSSGERAITIDLAATDAAPAAGGLPLTACDPFSVGASGDPDGDGLSSAQEAVLGTSPTNPDSDGDGLGDGLEAGVAGDQDPATTTDPLEADSDAGGVRDGVEDADGNGRVDAGESDPNDPTDDFPFDGDADLDTIRDSVEGDGDHDRDGTPDYLDPDSDDDGLADSLEAGDDDPETPPVDTDGDGAPDYLDLDSDGDGIQDVNDDCPTQPGESCAMPMPPGDADGDGVGDPADDCPEVWEMFQSDRDGDGVGDACDPDADGDGYLDGSGVTGGGCGVAGRGGGAPALLAGVLAMALLLSRRRRGALALVLFAAVPALAEAQEDFGLDRFRMAMDREGALDLEWGELPPPFTLDLGLVVTETDDPLVLHDPSGGRAGALVARRVASTARAAFTLERAVELGVEVPLVLYQTRDMELPGAVEENAMGDLRLILKAGLLEERRHEVGLALLAALTLPTAPANSWIGEGEVTFAPELAVSRVFGPARTALNVGWRMRESARFLDLEVNDELFARAGVAVRLADVGGPPLEVAASIAGATDATAPFEAGNVNALELNGAVAYRGREPASPLQPFAGGGVGLNDGYGTPDWRLLAGIRLSTDVFPRRRKARDRLLAVTPTAFVAAPVSDGVDSDADAVVDPADRCPGEAEDLDGVEDEDGCPELLPEEMVTGDRYGQEPDGDGDAVVDRLDVCPEEKGSPDEQGCKQKPWVVITVDRIEILEPVHFLPFKPVIRTYSYRVLDGVARALLAHPEIKKVQIEGHTDDRGDDAGNLTLSDQRARAVKDYLVGKGVPAERLESKGYGETRPIGDNKSKGGRARNRRIEFTILDP